MKLSELMRGIDTLIARGDADIDISSIASDSRNVTSGTLFIAVKGSEKDGHDFIDDALMRGAAGIVCEDESKIPKTSAGAVVVVRDSRDVLALVSSRYYGFPSDSLKLIGITGTNGKTTTSYLLKDILEKSGRKTGLIGTIQYLFGDKQITANHTTPGSIEYQRLLSDMKSEGCHYVVSEVSSHALSQKRVDHTRFSRAVYTNLSREHLDYHNTMEEYLQSKQRLFHELLDKDGLAILNGDDDYTDRIKKDIQQKCMTYGIQSRADVMAVDIRQDFEGISFVLHYKGADYPVRAKLIGIPSVYNMLAATATAITLDVPVDIIISALTETRQVDGRFETVSTQKGILFVIDYAHTPDALGKLLETVDSLPHRKIITVFGCGGNRDKGKRPLMGQIASNISDLVILTSDNPRYEDPEDIIKDIEEGIRDHNFISIIERELAIEEAVRRAENGDIVVVAGKGHETYQEIKGIRYPMSDRELIFKALNLSGIH